MIINIDREKLITPLKQMVGVSEKKQTMPILGNVLFRGCGDSLLLVSSDLEVEVSTKIDYSVEGEINTTMPARKLLDILKSLPGTKPIEIDVGENKATIKSGKSRFTLATLPGADFPYKDEPVSFNFSSTAEEFDKLIGQTGFSMATQDARHFLNGMFLETSSTNLTVVATDGHRLSMSSCPAKNNTPEPVTCIIPRKCIIEVKRILASFKDNKENIIEFSVSNKEILLKIDKFLIKSKLIEGNYPDYNKVFPESLPHKLNVDKDDLRSALQRMSILSNEQFKGVKLSLNNSEMMLSTNNPSQEEGEDSIPCTYTGDSFDIGFNLSYLLEVIDVISSDNIEIQLNNADSGCLISSDDKTLSNKYIIMPMRV
ncbi:MAG: DNA polymerase III subunit beta [Gammaproteobacteria bacterium]|nr:DNA polymerase III subunit beta [Gammaproteobacteria bacterium]MBT4462315.1 DNA polymerase III subunit beta [Gammaproteobacteria bacterium]MBT5117025.1 DNA polymerase III subunit beta [Gammaproteobacteria bacterium]MBT5762057.1 DNA polymerase III subunit beta [Gammaproteobacteria bacterium]MBT7932281.1 DNA polymerase III subunit beta [Gammaproteobacteria bacterium]